MGGIYLFVCFLWVIYLISVLCYPVYWTNISVPSVKYFMLCSCFLCHYFWARLIAHMNMNYSPFNIYISSLNSIFSVVYWGGQHFVFLRFPGKTLVINLKIKIIDYRSISQVWWKSLSGLRITWIDFLEMSWLSPLFFHTLLLLSASSHGLK